MVFFFKLNIPGLAALTTQRSISKLSDNPEFLTNVLFLLNQTPSFFSTCIQSLCLLQTWPIAWQCIWNMRYLDFVCPPNKVFHTFYWQRILQTGEENLSFFGPQELFSWIWTKKMYMFWMFSFRLVIHDVFLLLWVKNHCFHLFFLPPLDKSIVINA